MEKTDGLTPEQQRLVKLVIERAEQACRYVEKNVAAGYRGEAAAAFESACNICEGAIERQVMTHIVEDLAGNHLREDSDA